MNLGFVFRGNEINKAMYKFGLISTEESLGLQPTRTIEILQSLRSIRMTIDEVKILKKHNNLYIGNCN